MILSHAYCGTCIIRTHTYIIHVFAIVPVNTSTSAPYATDHPHCYFFIPNSQPSIRIASLSILFRNIRYRHRHSQSPSLLVGCFYVLFGIVSLAVVYLTSLNVNSYHQPIWNNTLEAQQKKNQKEKRRIRSVSSYSSSLFDEDNFVWFPEFFPS